MNEQELINAVREQLQHYFIKTEKIVKEHKNNCIRMILDFMPHWEKKQAEQFFNEKVVKGMTLYSGQFTPVRYTDDGSETIITSKFDGLNLKIEKEHIVPFAKELLKLAKSYKVLYEKIE